MDSKTARTQLGDLMRKHSDHGAQDSEGWQAVRIVEEAAEEGLPFPFTGRRNPFQLYQSVPGWKSASLELVRAAKKYWKALVQEKLGVKIA